MAAVALAERGHRVTTYSDRPVPFVADFRGYKQPKVVANKRMVGMIGKHDVYLGIPPYGGRTACQLARKYRTRAVVYLFDVLPLMIEAGRRDHGIVAAVYAALIRWIRTTNTRVMVLARHNRRAAARWLQIPENRVDVVYPGVNLKRIPEKLSGYERAKRVVWISRILPHKLFPHFLEAVKPFDVAVDVICARADRAMVDRYGMTGVVRFHTRITDEEKFGILSNSRLLVFKRCERL
jgi:glycosyltransferase involved in cell wall biosynthesis